MDTEALSIIDLGTDAMLELEELKQQLRSDAPSLSALFDVLRTPTNSPTFAGNSGMSMLDDLRSYAFLRDATGISAAPNYRDFAPLIKTYLNEMEEGVGKAEEVYINKAKAFCAALVNSFVARDMAEVYLKKESTDSRYMTHALI